MNQKKFDWHDYISIREQNPAYCAKIEVILDRIAQIPDGQHLIQKAYEVSGSGKNKVEIATSNTDFTFQGKPQPTKYWGTVGAADTIGNEGNYEGKLTIDLKNAGNTAYIAPDDKLIIVSQTDIMIHELFHLADPHTLPHVKNAELRQAYINEFLPKAIVIDGVPEATKQQLYQTAADRIINDFGTSWKFADIFKPGSQMMQDLQKIAGDRPITIYKPPKPFFTQQRGSVVGKDDYPEPPSELEPKHPFPKGGGPRHEEQAIDYTDRFMLQYFGKPPQQGYGNLVGAPKGSTIPHEPKLLDTSTPQDRLPAYKPDYFFPPNIKNIPKPLDFIPQAIELNSGHHDFNTVQAPVINTGKPLTAPKTER